MKFHQSLFTETTKQSLIPSHLQHSSSFEQLITVYAHSHHRLYSINLPLHSTSVQSLVEQALQRFQSQHQIQFQREPKNFNIFVARKNGKKYSDYPSIDPSQNIMLTKVNYYYLTKKKSQAKIRPAPQTQMAMSAERKEERKPKQGRSCFCLF